MPWGIAAGIVLKNAFSKNREFQTFFRYFVFHTPQNLFEKTGKNIAVGVSATRIDGIFYSLPSSQSTDTFRMSARAFNSISDIGHLWPSNKDSAGTLISIPASCNLASSSTCFIPCASRASVTRLPMMLRSPSSSFLAFILLTTNSHPLDRR